MNQFGIKDSLLKEIISILKKYPKVERAYIFGSRARGDYTKVSDIDIAVEGQNIESELLNFIEDEFFYLNTALEFDLVNLSQINKAPLQDNILKEGVKIYDK